ncbi:hypothetical protein THAOC_25876 [Thalassiosira oceanica]|uniref:Uncharacterized protein n=1 Tax=Thalassiosira oceanica TaxID=159749 RepID=K0S6I5_THAOC|nr:hypothetical protein THAOC_25876 [Thalassiosira oceanica]|eukprot:EJK54492.1 hypothetical protein THAOC_25876 [Thalassiosira oceanica]
MWMVAASQTRTRQTARRAAPTIDPYGRDPRLDGTPQTGSSPGQSQKQAAEEVPKLRSRSLAGDSEATSLPASAQPQRTASHRRARTKSRRLRSALCGCRGSFAPACRPQRSANDKVGSASVRAPRLSSVFFSLP